MNRRAAPGVAVSRSDGHYGHLIFFQPHIEMKELL
jgi:hypothetical protein